MERKPKTNRLLLVAHTLEVVRLDIEQYIAGYLSSLHKEGLRLDQVETLGFCCSVIALLENTQALLCESPDDPALAALSPDRGTPAH